MLNALSIVANQHAHAPWGAPTLGLVLSEEERKERLAYWISDTMRRRRLTPPKVAARIGVSRSAVTAWASGRSVPSMIYLGPLADALDVDPSLFADLRRNRTARRTGGPSEDRLPSSS